MRNITVVISCCRNHVMLVAAIVAQTALVGIAGAQQTQTGSRTTVAAAVPTALPATLDPATRERIEPILTRARERGLPVERLVAKAAEGVLRGAPSNKIVAAVEALEERLITAHMALAPAQPADIIAGADALHAGAKAHVLRTIRQYQPKSSVAVPLAVLAQLLSKGVSQDRASQFVYKLMERRATSQEMLAVGTEIGILAEQKGTDVLNERVATVLAALGQVGGSNGAIATAIAEGAIALTGGGKKR